MIEKKLPGWQARQKFLHSKDKKGTPAQLTALGEQALQAGALTDAFEYFRIAGHKPGLEKLKQIALEEGDSFLLGAVERLGPPFENDVWNRVGERALELGKTRFAKVAFERTKNETMLARLHDPAAPRTADSASV
jgi:hypothetical protein